MKKQVILMFPGLFFLIVMSSCFHNHTVSVSIMDDEDMYEMQAMYKKNKTHAVQVYLDEQLLNNSLVSVKDEFDEHQIILDDNSTVYINSNPGELIIKIDKTTNSEETCEKVKQVCENLKLILTDN